MRPSSTTLRELTQEINAAVELQAPIRQNINPLRLEICRRIHDTDITSLDKVIRNKQVLLIRADLDIMRSNNSLVRIRVVETLDVVQIADVERGDVVAQRERKVCKFTVVGDVRVDGEVVAGAGTEVEEEFGDTLFAVCVFAEGVDDPDLAGSDGGGERGAFLVAGDELDVLDAGAVGDGDCVDDLAAGQFPEAKGVGLLDAVDGGRLQDGEWDDEVGG